MTQSQRKLAGTVGLVLLLIAYPLAVAGWLGVWLASLPWWGSIPIFAVLGLFWFVPASWVIRWMVRPGP
ncbi:MAG: DUF2842 domain-containing protein [Devosia sp.]